MSTSRAAANASQSTVERHAADLAEPQGNYDSSLAAAPTTATVISPTRDSDPTIAQRRPR